jgi:hypothetical protein
MNSEIGDQCPNCREAGILHMSEQYVRCDNCDFERFSTQEELDHYVNIGRREKDPSAERLVTLVETEPYITPRIGRVMGMRDFDIKRNK